MKTTTTATALILLLGFGLALPAAAQTADIVDTSPAPRLDGTPYKRLSAAEGVDDDGRSNEFR